MGKSETASGKLAAGMVDAMSVSTYAYFTTSGGSRQALVEALERERLALRRWQAAVDRGAGLTERCELRRRFLLLQAHRWVLQREGRSER